MMIDSLPTTVEVGGREFVIVSDFRTSILFEQMMQDPDIDPEVKVLQACNLYYPDERPDDMTEAINACVWFYTCGKELKQYARDAERQRRRNNGKRTYDYDIDAQYFYTAFLSQYNVDLQDIEYLHWWKFMAMFLGLTEDHMLSKIMSYRAADLSKIKSKDERARIAALQSRYRLPDIRTKQQKSMDVGSLFGGLV